MNFQIVQSVRGWQAETEHNLPDDRLLKILTMKRSSGQLGTTVRAIKVEGGFETYAPFSDYNKVLVTSLRKATQGAIRSQHEEALQQLDSLIREATEFYK